MNSLSFIHSGSSANVKVFLETGLEKDAGASESSSSVRRERDTCRWRRGADKVMTGGRELSAQPQFSHLNISSRNARQAVKDTEEN
jgi:hypothetical protein